MIRFLPFTSTVITAIFAAAVFLRYTRRGGMHLLMWGIGLTLYGLGTFSEAFLGLTYSPFMLRVWYITGAMLTAAWLGQGTLYLLVRKSGVAHAAMLGLAVVSALAIIAVMAAPVNSTAAYNVHLPASVQYKAILSRGALVITLTILLNIYGTLALVGGAIYSAFIFWRKRVLPNRVIGNVLIAAGALLPASAGTFVKLGLADWLYLSELLGATIMFIGFLQATAHQPSQSPAMQPAQS
jgi:hypothetical protein